VFVRRQGCHQTRSQRHYRCSGFRCLEAPPGKMMVIFICFSLRASRMKYRHQGSPDPTAIQPGTSNGSAGRPPVSIRYRDLLLLLP
jgi:hypothetical protein